jgi:hypothetical protein
MKKYDYIYNVIGNEKQLITKIHPKIEIYRCNIILSLMNKFTELVRNINPTIKQSSCEEYLSLFIWKNITDIDPVIPYHSDNVYDINYLYQFLINRKISPENADLILQKLDIPNYFEKSFKKFNTFQQKLEPAQRVKIEYKNEHLHYLDYSVKCPRETLIKLNFFFNKKYPYNPLILYFCLLYRYSIVDAKNQQLSTISCFKDNVQEKLGVDFEMFGSSLNRFFKTYGSLFYDLEQYFGSVGNFFNIEPIQGLYIANPPFDDELMTAMTDRLLFLLEKSKKPLGFIITVPVWDSKTFNKMNKICHTGDAEKDYSFETRDKIISSKFLHATFVFCKTNFPYYSFTQYKTIPAANTYLFILKNKYLEFDTKYFQSLLHKCKLIEIKDKRITAL